MPSTSRRALLRRIEDELALGAALPELGDAFRAVVAIEGGAGPVLPRLRPASFGGVADQAVHAIAALEVARFRVASAGDDEPALEETAARLTRAWCALADRPPYLAALAVPLLGSSAARAPALTASIGVDRVIATLLDRARAGGELGGLLRATSKNAAIPGELGRRAARARLEALDAVLDPLRRTLDELATRRPSLDEVVAAFAAVRLAWRRCDRDMELEVLAVERLADFAWDLYRDRKLVDLARVVEEVAEPGASLAARIERDAAAIAWAAPCAQVLVFRAELAPRFDAQLELAERAHAVCPTLRNARLVLGDFLLTRAERALDRASDTTTAGTRPEDDVARAASLHPDLRRLAGVKDKLGKRQR